MEKVIHFTMSRNIDSILSNGFRISEHKHNKSQWLGNGVYFFDYSKQNFKIGKSMVSKKKDFEGNVASISLFVDLDNDRHFDIYNRESRDILKNFIKAFINQMSERDPKILRDLIDLEIIFESFMKGRRFEKPFGHFLGHYLNVFCDYYEGVFDVVSFRFFMREIDVALNLYDDKLKEVTSRQICVKNIAIIPDVKEWEVCYSCS